MPQRGLPLSLAALGIGTFNGCQAPPAEDNFEARLSRAERAAGIEIRYETQGLWG